MIEYSLIKDPIEITEREMRALIWDVLVEKYGPNWINDESVGLGLEWAKKLENKSESDKSVQRDINIHEIPLAYAEFLDLKNIIIKNQNLFKSVFNKWEKMMEYMDTIISLRNVVKHHRDISPTQQHLLIGISGEIIDSINLWRIGSKLNLKRIMINFTDYISTENKTESQILEESRNKIINISNSIQDALRVCNVNIVNIEKNDFEIVIDAKHVKVNISTTSKSIATSRINNIDYKIINTVLYYNVGCRESLDNIINNINKAYWVIEYHLEDNININLLKMWSENQAGLSPRSSVASNGNFDSIEYGFLGGKIRVGVGRYLDDHRKTCGKLYLIHEHQTSKWLPHKVITMNDLTGFILGNISPKTIMYLHKLSLSQ